MNSADQEFLTWVAGYEKWYDRESSKWVTLLDISKIFTLVSSVVSVVLAASVTKDFFAGWGRWLIVLGSALTVLSSEMVAQFQIRRMEDLREKGNIEMSHLYAYTRDKFDEYSNDREKISAIKTEVRDRIRVLEELQQRGFVDINSEIHPSARKADS